MAKKPTYGRIVDAILKKSCMEASMIHRKIEMEIKTEDMQDMASKYVFNECIREGIEDGEIINVSPELDNMLMDTTPLNQGIPYPYPSFFINRRFQVNGSIINGVAANIMELPQDNFTGINELQMLAMSLMTITDQGNVGQHPIIVPFSDDDDEHVSMTKAADSIDIQVTQNEENKYTGTFNVDQDCMDVVKQATKYTRNLLYLLTTNNKDIQLVKTPITKREYNFHSVPLQKKATTIQVTGELKRYIQNYDKDRNSPGFKHSFIVRGHWRTFRSDWYKEKKGTTKWIPPFIKGMSSEVSHREINVK